MNRIEKVVHSYGINPLKIEPITNSLYKVDDAQQSYALKKSTLSNKTIGNWENVFRQADSGNLTEILPVYLTKQDGSLYKKTNEAIFYLTPWINGNQPTIERFYSHIGRLHAKTNQSQHIDNKKMNQQFRIYRGFCENAIKRLLGYVERCEESEYMSPFELQVCTHFRDLELVFKKIITRINQLMDEQNKQSTWNYCLCHGNLTFSHILGIDQLYMINWEKATYENAALDLAVFFKNEVIEYDAPTESFINLFKNYTNENNLNTSELYLLNIHLLDPTTYITIVEHYFDNRHQNTMVDHVRKLQRTYRQLLFGLQFSNYVEKEYETKELSDLES